MLDALKRQWSSIAPALVLALLILFFDWLNLSPQWLGLVGGTLFGLLGLVIAVSGLIRLWPGRKSVAQLAQAVGGCAIGLFMAGLGTVSVTEAIVDIWPATLWTSPTVGHLRTWFWNADAFANLACWAVEEAPPEALRFALEERQKLLREQTRIACQPRSAGTTRLLSLTDDPQRLRMVLQADPPEQHELDARLVELCRVDARPAIEMLLEAGANPNAEVEGESAVLAAFFNHQTSLAVYLLEHGASANLRYRNGSTLLDEAARVDRVDLREPYVALLKSYRAADAAQP